MFFPDRIKNIKDGDRVLEIGPGSSPFPRADVLLELKHPSTEAYKLHCGDDGMTGTDPRTIFYDGDKLPFQDQSFDYVICSHVLEHIQNVEHFCSEIFRVGKAGYFEYPLFYYEYVYDIPAHCTILKRVGNELAYAEKSTLLNPEDAPVRRFWYEALSAGHTENVRGLLNHIMEGFEWEHAFPIRKAKNVQELCHPAINLNPPSPTSCTRAISRARKILLFPKKLLLTLFAGKK